MNEHVIIFLYINFFLTAMIYFYIFKYRKLIGFQLGMNIAMIAGGMLAMSTGIVLIYQFPLHFVIITITSTVIGMVTGALFGGMFDYQTLLTGYANGLMVGLMAPMVGAAAKNSLPFIYFIEMVMIISFFLLLSSTKKS